MIIENLEHSLNGSLLTSVIQKANAKKSKGEDVLSLAVGEPYFKTREEVKRAGIAAIQENKTGYSPATGLGELKAEIVKHYGLAEDVSIAVSSGAKPLIPAAIHALSKTGGIVAVLGPAYPTFVESSLIMGRKVLQIDALENGKHKSIDAILHEIDSSEYSVQVLIINSPNNPSGRVYTEFELAKIAKECERRKIAIISDETYEDFVYGDNFFVSIHDVAGDYRNYIVIKSFSKSHALTGWRVGYAFGEKYIMKKVGDYLTACVGNAPTMSQWAAVKALKERDGELVRLVKEFKENRNILVEWLQRKGIKTNIPEGGFYVFADFSPLLKNGKDGTFLCHEILEKANVSLAPGATYGEKYRNFVRLSSCVKTEKIKDAIKKIDRII